MEPEDIGFVRRGDVFADTSIASPSGGDDGQATVTRNRTRGAVEFRARMSRSTAGRAESRAS